MTEFSSSESMHQVSLERHTDSPWHATPFQTHAVSEWGGIAKDSQVNDQNLSGSRNPLASPGWSDPPMIALSPYAVFRGSRSAFPVAAMTVHWSAEHCRDRTPQREAFLPGDDTPTTVSSGAWSVSCLLSATGQLSLRVTASLAGGVIWVTGHFRLGLNQRSQLTGLSPLAMTGIPVTTLARSALGSVLQPTAAQVKTAVSTMLIISRYMYQPIPIEVGILKRPP